MLPATEGLVHRGCYLPPTGTKAPWMCSLWETRVMLMHDHTLLFAALNMLWIVGVWNAALPGQILDPIASWMAGDSHAVPPVEGNAPDWINKPLFLCPMCMASVHGTLWWFMFNMGSVWFWPVYVVCLSGAMKLITILVLNKDS